jgi:hypothetical protein
MTRLLNGAIRHGIQVPGDYTKAPDTIDRYIQSPDVDYQRETMFTSVSHYVGGAFDSEMWDAGNAPVAMVQEYLYWAYGWTQSSFKLLSNLLLARMCFRLERGSWAGILLRAGFAELNICLRDQPYQALSIILILLNHLREQPPDARKNLLNQCLGLIEEYKYARNHPIKRIFDQVSEMEQGDYDCRFCDSMFAQATFCFVDKLSDQLGENGDFVCAVLRNTNQLLAVPGSEENRSVQRWINPVERRKEDPEYFNSNQNVERCVVQAVELHGYLELLQVREALNQQRNAALSDQVRQILTLHLHALEGPIHRIGYRDSVINGDKDGFVKHWQKLTDNRDLLQAAWDPGYLPDMLCGWKLFTEWEEVDKVRRVEQRLGEIFTILDKQLGKDTECLSPPQHVWYTQRSIFKKFNSENLDQGKYIWECNRGLRQEGLLSSSH